MFSQSLLTDILNPFKRLPISDNKVIHMYDTFPRTPCIQTNLLNLPSPNFDRPTTLHFQPNKTTYLTDRGVHNRPAPHNCSDIHPARHSVNYRTTWSSWPLEKHGNTQDAQLATKSAPQLAVFSPGPSGSLLDSPSVRVVSGWWTRGRSVQGTRVAFAVSWTLWEDPDAGTPT